VVEQPYEASVQRWRETVRGPLAFMAMALALLLFMTAISWRNARLREQAQRQRYAAMHEIQLREQELSQLFANVQELIFRTDPQGVIEFANARWSALSMQGRALTTGWPLSTARPCRLVQPCRPQGAAGYACPGATEWVRSAHAGHQRDPLARPGWAVARLCR